MYSSRLPGQHGFSLLEILVAFSILAIFLGVLLNIFSGGLRGAVLTKDYAYAVQLAEQVMTLAGRELPLLPGYREGNDEAFHWRIVIEPYTPPERDWQPDQSPYQLYHVGVSITWGDLWRRRQFVLNSLRLARSDTAAPASSISSVQKR
jgi:general secretion pathway protein I